MTRPLYLLDLPVLAELTRPAGNRRVLNLFHEHQSVSMIAAPVAEALLRGVDALPEGARRSQLWTFAQELLRSGPTVLAFDREAALWMAREAGRRSRSQRPWTHLQGQQAAIAVTRELSLVTANRQAYAGVSGLRIDDWFRP
jgi:predicted nucleic acid-binding protein